MICPTAVNLSHERKVAAVAEGYWELFWQTGLPEAWLVWRAAKEPDAMAAFGEEKDGGTQI